MLLIDRQGTRALDLAGALALGR